MRHVISIRRYVFLAFSAAAADNGDCSMMRTAEFNVIWRWAGAIDEQSKMCKQSDFDSIYITTDVADDVDEGSANAAKDGMLMRCAIAPTHSAARALSLSLAARKRSRRESGAAADRIARRPARARDFAWSWRWSLSRRATRRAPDARDCKGILSARSP